jgi:hypothetical protein
MLSDIPTFPPTVPTADDLLAVIDSSDRRSPKRATVAQVVEAGQYGGGYGQSGFLSPVPGIILGGGSTGRFRIEISNAAAETQIIIGSLIGNVVFSNHQTILGSGVNVISPSTFGIPMNGFGPTIVEVTMSVPSGSENDMLTAIEETTVYNFIAKITRIA